MGSRGRYLPVSSGSFGPVVWKPDGGAGEVGRLDHPRPGAGRQPRGDVLLVLPVLIAAGLPARVRDRGHQPGSALSDPRGQDRESIAKNLRPDGPSRSMGDAAVRQEIQNP